VSMVTLHTFLTVANNQMFAIDWGLYQTTPKFVMSPISLDTCIPLLVWTVTCDLLFLILESSLGFLNTVIIDWLSMRSYEGGIAFTSFCEKEKPVKGEDEKAKGQKDN
jgi:hypothetical protein